MQRKEACKLLTCTQGTITNYLTKVLKGGLGSLKDKRHSNNYKLTSKHLLGVIKEKQEGSWRSARNVSGKVIMYADEMTQAMREAIEEVERRRQVQLQYNREHGITPQTIRKPIRDALVIREEEEELPEESLTPSDAKKLIVKLNKKMREYAKIYEFERAAQVRDHIAKLRKDFNLA